MPEPLRPSTDLPGHPDATRFTFPALAEAGPAAPLAEDLAGDPALACITVTYAAGDARRAQAVASRLRGAGLTVAEPAPGRAAASGIYYARGQDRALAARIAVLAGLALPPALSAEPFGAAALSPGAVRIVLGPEAAS